MPVFLDVESRLDRSALTATAREIRQAFDALGKDISHGLGGSLSKAFSGFDTSAARQHILAMQQDLARLRDAELETARVAQRSAAEVEASARRAAEATAKWGDASSQAAKAQMLHADAQARAARDMRANADAIVASEAAHRKLAGATEDSAATASRAAAVFNGVGIASVAGFGAAMVETTKKAGDFQQSQQRLVSSAGETSANLKAVSDGILQLAGQVGYSAQELSNGMYTVEKAGYRGADGVNVLKASAQLAKAENADLGEVLNGLTTSMHDFGYGQERAAEVASKMNTAVGLAKTNLQEFSGALHSVEPIASNAHIKLEDVYGSLAQITQSGTSADQAAQNMAHSISQLMKPSQQAREEMGQLGIDARDVQAHLGDRGYAGTVQYLSDTIRQHMNPAGQVVIDTMFKSQQATDAATQIFNNLPPAAKAVAQAIKDGTLSYKDFRKTRGGLDVEQANEINQWNNLNNKVTGYSAALKSGQGDIQTYEQALALMTGGQDSLRTVLQLVGENAQATNDKIKAIKGTTAETDGTVKGFNETQETLNAKMADAKAAFGAAAIEMGNAFIPVMTQVANVAKDVGDAMAKHPGIAHAVIDALGLLGAAWLGFKALNIAETVLAPIARGLGGIIAGEEGATRAAAGLSTGLGALGTAAAGIAAAAAADSATHRVEKAHPGLRPITQALLNSPSGFHWGKQAYDWLTGEGHASGGPVHGRGPKGIDSVPAWLAPGEHVLTHHDVAAMGGHGAVHAFRNALHRQYGGEVGPDVQAAMAMDGAKYSQGERTDCSGMVGRVINAAMGIPGGGLPTTQNMGQWLAARGFVNGIGPAGTISVGWYNHGSGTNDGHAAMTLSDGENAESGGSHGNFIVGAGAAGASSAQFDRHMYLPELFGEGQATGGMGGFGGFGAAMGGFGGGGFGGGGIPAGATAGTGPGGMPGYYTANPQRVASAQEQLRHIDAEIAAAEKRKSELKADASQSTRDRLDEEIRHLKAERVQEEQRLQEAERGTFHAGHGRGGMGGIGLPVPLADRFGLGKGLPGLAEWAVGFLEDLVLGPMETAVMAGLGGGMGDLGGSGMAAALGPLTGGPLGGSGLGGAPGAAGGVPGVSGPSGGSSAPSVGSGGAGAAGTSLWWAPGAHGAAAPAAAPPPGAPGAPGWFGNPWFGTAVPTPQAVRPGSAGADVPFPSTGTSTDSMLRGQPYAPDNRPAWQRALDPHRPAGAPTGGDGLLPGMYGVNPGAVQHHAAGGPSGSDTIPSWLSPGEFVEQPSAVQRYGAPFMDALNQGRVDPSSVRYFGGGGPTDFALTPPPPAPAPGPKTVDQAAAPKPGQPAKPGADIHGGKPPTGGPVPLGAPQGAQTHAGLNQPGSSKELFGEGLPASQGIGFGGGFLGAAEGAASQAAGMAASMGTFGGAGGAASSATQMAFQLLNRTAAYGAQDAGILAEGIIETLSLSDSPLSDFGKTLPGKLLAGVAGVRPAENNTAGQTKAPLTSDQAGAQAGGGGGGDTTHIGVQMNGVDIHSNNAEQFHNDLSRQHSAAVASYGDVRG
ncbi:hypothetical protein AWC11_07320 [Mycobacterium interjectum]|nr:hypothetical protein AWC11_07320 [Mycobacterium interjectum]